ncbi:hypothetical protein [Williamwhitmania taraxaci]|uniref:Chain length determinant protein n=1 Tax=Williamwhitmania taraxaci TaxID=1640674 RepID=A0A1G6GP73_9BACT|nr:hypothetical protein [Williamwhitmania taraxaci]SDB82986.1 hypothetical protein SAMN05216323_100246 [Williamwhitmania taraxaci]
MENQKHNEEIDLLDLFNRMGKSIQKGINWGINLIYQFFLLLIRKSLWILTFTCIGVSIGLLLFFNTNRFYTSNMVAKCNSTENNIVVDAINQLNDLCINNNFEMLARYLETSPRQAAQIKLIKAYYGIDINRDSIADYIDYLETYNAKDTSQRIVRNMVFVKVEVFNEDVFSDLRDGLQKYIWKNPYIAKNNEVRKEQTAIMISSMDRELKNLDSLQKSYRNNLMQKSGNGQMVLLNEKEIKLIYPDIIKLVSQKQKLEKSLIVDPDPLTIIQDFTPLSKAVNPWTKYVKSWGLSFALLGFILSLLWQYKRTIITLIGQKQY